MIVAVDESGGYAKGRKIPWSFKADWKHFKTVTSGTVCIMGRGTYEDIAERRKKRSPNFRVLLPGRKSYVISRTITEAQGAEGVCTSVHNVLDRIDDSRNVYLLGGRRIWVTYLDRFKQIWMTIVPGEHGTTKKFPIEFLENYEIVEGRKEIEGDQELIFIKYVRKVKYYTIRTAHKGVAKHFAESNRLITKDKMGITFIDPWKGELKEMKRIGQLSVRQGLAVE